MTMTPGYTVDALLQAINERIATAERGRVYHGDVLTDATVKSLNDLIARAAELTQVTAQSAERASPAKDSGPRYEPIFDVGALGLQPIASQMRATCTCPQFGCKVHTYQMRPQSAVQGWQPIETAPKDVPVQCWWGIIGHGNGSQMVAKKIVDADGEVFWLDCADITNTLFTPGRWMPLPDAPQPPQGEGNE